VAHDWRDGGFRLACRIEFVAHPDLRRIRDTPMRVTGNLPVDIIGQHGAELVEQVIAVFRETREGQENNGISAAIRRWTR